MKAARSDISSKQFLAALGKFMPVEVFIGGNGDLVLLQEHTRQGDETYLRIMVDIDNAEALADQIRAVALSARKARLT
ncbi:hypothetical protein ACVII1_007139 [Bradyrhizobium elkanii]